MHLLAEAAGPPTAPKARAPARCRNCVARRTGLTASEHMTEGGTSVAFEPFEPFESGCDPGHRVDRAIMAARNGVVPLHGLIAL